MTMQNPLDFTQSDLAGLMEAGQTIANLPGVGGGSSPLGGISELLDTVQKGLNMFEQFQQSVDKFGTTIARLRGAEGLGQPEQSGFFPPGQVVEGNMVYRPPDQVTTTPTNPEPASEPEPVPAVQPVEVYAKALGWLAKLPPEMTMKEALELAKSNKGMILGAIEKELPDLLRADGPSE
jgi:hypothetical protein|tara:strand:- start:847 stop:1383 length:537 start_codon:yes stop_codon:yes gene_type:complete